MNILVISRGLPSAQYPMNGIFEFDQAKALASFGMKVTYFSIDLRSIRRVRKYWISYENRCNVDCYTISLPIGRVPRSIFLKIGMLALKKLYKKVYTDNKPDIIHAHFTEYGHMAVSLSKREKVPLVITEHSSEMNKTKVDNSLLNCAKYAYSNAQRVIAVGNELSQSILYKTGIKCIVIPNVVNSDEFESVNRKDKPNSFGFICTGSLIARKRQSLLIKAFAKIHELYPEIRLGIIGDGLLKSEIEKEINIYHIQNVVTLYGLKSRTEMVNIYSEYDCFVLPSSRETFGVVYIEAMLAGLPVIATRCGGPEDFITKDTGVLVTKDDEQELIEAMKHMIKNQGQYDPHKIKKYVKNKFAGDIIAKQLENVYLDLIQ